MRQLGASRPARRGRGIGTSTRLFRCEIFASAERKRKNKGPAQLAGAGEGGGEGGPRT